MLPGDRVIYIAGGNPSIVPGLFTIERPRKRIAWWPADVAVSAVLVCDVVEEYERTGAVVSRARVQEIAHAS